MRLECVEKLIVLNYSICDRPVINCGLISEVNEMDINKIKELAENDVAKAQNDLGVAYLTGNGVDFNEQQAVYWFHRASSQGNPEATANLGMCLLLGKGITKAISAALYVLESAYLMGSDNVIQNILDAINNKDVDINTIISLAEINNTQAEWILGLCYDHGLCVKRDTQKAIELFNDAGENNNPVALWILAHFFANSAEPDLLCAKRYLEKVEELAEKQVGILGNTQIKRDISDVSERLQKECAFLLMKVVPECVENGQPKDKYVQDLLDGKLFMKTLDQFGDISKRDPSSNNDFRGDILEGYSESFGIGYNPHLYKEDGNGIIPDGMLGSIDMLALRKKVYCLAAIDYYKPYHALIKPSEKMKEFGKYAVIINDVEEFLKRVHRAYDRYCKENNASYHLAYNKVSYDVDLYKEFNYSEFHKSKSYSWQNEFRISLDFSEGKFSSAMLEEVTDFAKLTFPGKIELDVNPLSLSDRIYFEIGDIRDICQCMEVEELFSEKITSIHIEKEPTVVKSYETPHKPRPTFCKGVIEVEFSSGKHHLAVSKEAFFNAIL